MECPNKEKKSPLSMASWHTYNILSIISYNNLQILHFFLCLDL